MNKPLERRYSPEKIGTISISHGTADVMRELAPTGEIVAHAIKHGCHVHERMYQKGTISDDLFSAAEKFRQSFAKAHLSGKYATIDFFRVRGLPNSNGSDAVAAAMSNIKAALSSLGSSDKQGLSVTQSAVWFLIGCGDSLEDYAWRIRSSGGSMTPDRASGIIISACERLALHYGLIRASDIRDQASKLAYQTGLFAGHKKAIQWAKDIAKTLSAKSKNQSEFLAEFTKLLDQNRE